MGCAFVVLLIVRQHSSSQLCDCLNPAINLTEHVRSFNHVNGFEHKEVNAIYDCLLNRAVFVHVLLDDESLHRPPLTTSVKTLRGKGQLVPFQLGGSDDPMNLFPQNKYCRMSQWNDFSDWVKMDVVAFGKVNYCVQLTYPDNQTDTPSEVIGHVQSHFDNQTLHWIALDNSLNTSECYKLPLELDKIVA